MPAPLVSDRLPAQAGGPRFAEAVRFWLKLGFISFGGPAGQIAIMHEELVERRRWVGEERFLHALNFCMLLPGPEAQQLAIYCGWLLHGIRGGLVAGTLFVLPSAIMLWAFSYGYVTFGAVPAVAAGLYGLKPVVLALVAAAVMRIGGKVLRNPAAFFVAILSALELSGLLGFRLPYPAVVLGAGALGWMSNRWAPHLFAHANVHSDAPDAAVPHSPPRPGWLRRVLVVAGVGGALWAAPVLCVIAWLGKPHVLAAEAMFFGKAALVTFGGAYAVLPYVAQQAVGHFGWLNASQMLDGLGLAETTPGPLIMVLQFVGFLGAWNQPGPLSPLAAATLGAALTTWVTFVPCFIWIFLGAPYVERLRGNRALSASLSAISAAVVGVIFHLAVWFGWHVLRPAPHQLDLFATLLAAGAFVGLLRWKWNVLVVIAAGGFAGFLWKMLVP